MVGVTGSAVLVVEGTSSGAAGQRAECPLIEGVVETFVADVAGEHDTFTARRNVNGEVPA